MIKALADKNKTLSLRQRSDDLGDAADSASCRARSP